jgi:hypothetical protein
VSPFVPTFNHIKSKVAILRQKDGRQREVRTIGIRATGTWSDSIQQQDGDDLYSIEQCDSPLAVRLALRQRQPEVTVQVILTALDEDELGTDILLRFVKRKLINIDRWDIVKSLFDAINLDPRLTQYNCLADYLMDAAPTHGYPSAISGFLDAETAWNILLKDRLGLMGDRLDLFSLLEWATIPDNIQCYQQAPQEFQTAILSWLSSTIGPIAQAIISCANAPSSEPSDVIAVGIVLDILFNEESNGREIDRAIGKLEANYLSLGSQLQPIAHIWSHSALEILRLKITDAQEQRKIIDRADKILQDLNVDTFAYHSDVSAIGYTQRLTNFAHSILEVIKTPHDQPLQKLSENFDRLMHHEQAKQARDDRHLEQCRMILRLSRWLVHHASYPPIPAKSLDEAVLSELQQGGFIDWARLKLHHGNNHRPLAEAMKALFDTVTKLREEQAYRFAQLLQGWVELGSNPKVFTPIEDVLSAIVAPLMAQTPVLLVVMDGMGTAACNELITNITKNNEWNRIVPETYQASLMAGLATIPSITKISRTSLLCGALKSGVKNNEVKGFSTHPQLSQNSNGSAPLLFHKSALRKTGDQILGDEVRKAIATLKNRVVGVVINAIDDNLKQGEQININWNLDSLPILGTLLYEAKSSNRTVIILSDHGHIIESNSDYQAKLVAGQDGGERWHSNLDDISDGEMLLKGDRVVIPANHQIVVPWSEKIRYAKSANGYHGGINPQEMVIPIAILHNSKLPKGWKESPEDQPIWWNSAISTQAEILTNPRRNIQSKQQEYGPLFSNVVEEEIEANPYLWIDNLLQSLMYGNQNKKSGKAALDDAIVREILTQIERYAYSIHLVVLAKSMNVSAKQMQSYFLKIQRTLNIDGYQVLSYDPSSMQIKLSLTLLKEQFEI